MSSSPMWRGALRAARRPAARGRTRPSPVLEGGVETLGTRTKIRRRDLSIPSWVVFCMIMLATFAVCVTVTMRTYAERGSAERKFAEMNTDVQKIHQANLSLRRDIERLHKDP